jgi:hypothetical protein
VHKLWWYDVHKGSHDRCAHSLVPFADLSSPPSAWHPLFAGSPDNDNTPTWNSCWTFSPHSDEGGFYFKVYDEDLTSSDDYLGKTEHVCFSTCTHRRQISPTQLFSAFEPPPPAHAQ